MNVMIELQQRHQSNDTPNPKRLRRACVAWRSPAAAAAAATQGEEEAISKSDHILLSYASSDVATATGGVATTSRSVAIDRNPSFELKHEAGRMMIHL